MQFPMPRAMRTGWALLLAIGALAGASRCAIAADARWTAIRRVFGQQGEVGGRYFRVDLPRSDLHVRIGADALDPDFEFTSYVGFIPMRGGNVMAMGEVVLRDDEVANVLAEAHRRNVRITALHNHLLGETPRIVYVHVMAEGGAEQVALALRAVYAASATPLAAPHEERPNARWGAIDEVLGPHAEAHGRVAEYEFPRKEKLSVHGMAVQSSGVIESASEAVFQQLPGHRVASTGELFVLPSEVDPVVRALDRHGLHVTAVHNHMVDGSPPMYWIHWYATGAAPALARGVAAALARTHGARRSEAGH
jgi:uncharacterized protein DUF1259